MKTIALLAFCATLLLSGCDKFSGPTEVSGIVVDRHTGQPVAGAYVVAVSGSSSWAGGSGTSAGTLADAQGRFAFTFEGSAKSQYQVGTSTASGYTNQGNGPLLRVGKKNDNLLVNADAPAWVRVNCIDDPPYSRVGLYTDGYSYGDKGIYDQQNIGPGNFSFVRPTPSYNSERHVHWEITDLQANQYEGRIPYTTTGFDTVTVTLHF